MRKSIRDIPKKRRGRPSTGGRRDGVLVRFEADQFEALVIQQMPDVAARSTEIIVDANDIGARGKKPLAEMRAQEAGAAGDQYPLCKMH